MARASLRLEADSGNSVIDRGRLLFVEDVTSLLRGRKTAWWIRHRFAPASKLKVGRNCAWFERDALEWIAGQRTSQ